MPPYAFRLLPFSPLLTRYLQDKHAKNLTEKLAARLPRCETERQWNDTAFAIGLLGQQGKGGSGGANQEKGHNEDIAKLLAGGFRVVTVGGD